MTRGSVRAPAALARAPGRPSTEAKLALVEALIGVEDADEGIRHTLDWLGKHIGLPQAVVAEVDTTGTRLVGSAGYGIPARRIARFSVGLGERDHPLVATLVRTRAVVLEPAGAARVRRALPFRGAVAVSPLEGRHGRERVLGGLLMGSPASPAIAADLQWLAAILGALVIRTRWRPRVARGRSLLHATLDAVPDSVMPTEERAATYQLLANMSHEIRTPLNAILGYTSMLLKGVLGPLTVEQTEGLSRLASNSRHLIGIVNDILDLSHIDAGRMAVRITRFRLAGLVAEILAEIEPIIARSGLAFATALDSRLPAVRTDRQKLKQILLNLLTNAVKFTPRGAVTVSAAPSHDPGGVAISVTDTGLGIASDDQARIFEDFQQADNSPTRVFGGAGLGLAICNRLVIMLGGRIHVESTLGEGSTFTVVLPARRRRR